MMNSPAKVVRRELEQLLENDEARLGDVYRLDKEGLTQHQIAEKLGVNTSNFVVNNRTIARAMLAGELPTGPAFACVVAGAIRKRMKSDELSDNTKDYLQSLLARLQPAEAAEDGHAGPAFAQDHGEAVTLRDQVEAELRARAEALVEEIRAEAAIDADDYYRLVSAGSSLDALERLVQVQATNRTTKALAKAGRMDLSLEQAVVQWAKNLPLTKDLVENARARLGYWRSE